MPASGHEKLQKIPTVRNCLKDWEIPSGFKIFNTNSEATVEHLNFLDSIHSFTVLKQLWLPFTIIVPSHSNTLLQLKYWMASRSSCFKHLGPIGDAIMEGSVYFGKWYLTWEKRSLEGCYHEQITPALFETLSLLGLPSFPAADSYSHAHLFRHTDSAN